MPAPESIWVKCEWQADELDKQTIEFRIPLKDGGIAHSIGTLRARSRKLVDDRISVEIEKEQLIQPWKKHQVVFQIPEKYADRVELHPNQEIATFRLMIA